MCLWGKKHFFFFAYGFSHYISQPADTGRESALLSASLSLISSPVLPAVAWFFRLHVPMDFYFSARHERLEREERKRARVFYLRCHFPLPPPNIHNVTLPGPEQREVVVDAEDKRSSTFP